MKDSGYLILILIVISLVISTFVVAIVYNQMEYREFENQCIEHGSFNNNKFYNVEYKRKGLFDESIYCWCINDKGKSYIEAILK